MTFHALLGVLSAVITGLAVVKFLQGILWMIHGRGQIKVYWVHLVWIGVAIFGALLHFWYIVKLRNTIGEADLYGIADLLWIPMLHYLLAGLLFPPSAENLSGHDRPVDLQDFYYENRAWIFGTIMVCWLTNAGNLRSIVTQPLAWDTLGFVLPATLIYVALMVTPNKWFHMAIAALMPLSLFLLILFVESTLGL